jgi:hypothetical protein
MVIWTIHEFHHMGYYEGAKQNDKRMPQTWVTCWVKMSFNVGEVGVSKAYLPNNHPYQHNTIQFNGKVKHCPMFTLITLIKTLEIQHLPQMVWNINPFL